MVTVNVVASLLIFFSAIFYKYIYPRKKINLFILLITISFLPAISIFRTGTYESGDFNIHIYRTIDFYKNLIEGNFMPSWAPSLNASFGYPLFIFNYSLPYYFLSLFHILGATFINSLKIFLALNLVFSSVFMYLAVREKFKNELSSFIAGIFYLFAPYHLIATHFKITIGEILSYTFLPLYFLFLERSLKSNVYLLISGLILGAISLSHIFISIVLVPLTFFYFVFRRKTFLFFPVFIIASLISLYQWVPVLIFKNVLFTTLHPIDLKTLYFPNIFDLLYSPWRFGLLFQGPRGEISSLIGYAQLLVIFSIIYLLIKKKIEKTDKKEIVVLLLILAAIVFMILPQSKLIWQNLPFINAAGPHRLLILICFTVSLLSGYLPLIIKNKIFIYILIIFAIVSTILNWGQRRVMPQINDTALINNLELSTSQGEGHFYAATKYQNPNKLWFSEIFHSRIQFIKGEGLFKAIRLSSTNHIYKLFVEKDSQIKENTLYFPGWRAFANGKEVRIFADKQGIINFYLPKGSYYLTLSYEDLYIYKISKIISLLAFISVLLYFAKLKYSKA